MHRSKLPVILLGGSLLAASICPTYADGDRVGQRTRAYIQFFEAQQLLEEGRVGEARTKLEQVLESDPQAAEAHSLIARICLRSNDLICAEQRAARAVEISPNESMGHRVLADIDIQRYQRSHDPQALEDALKHLAAATEAEPQDTMTWVGWIRLLCNEDRFQEAEAVARRAAAVPGVEPAVPWLSLSRALVAKKQEEKAIALLERVDTNGRAMIPVLEALADLKKTRGDLRGQVSALQKLREFRPDDPELAYRLGVLKLEQGDFFSAVAPLREAFDARPGDPLARRDLARALVRSGKGAEALELMSGLPKAYRDPHTLLVWAQAGEQAGRFEAAGERLEELMAGLGEDDRKSYGPTLRFRAARNFHRGGNETKALDLLRGLENDPQALRLKTLILDTLGRSAEVEGELQRRLVEEPGNAGLVALIAERAARRGTEDDGLKAGLVSLRGNPKRIAVAAEAALWLGTWNKAHLAARLIDAVGLPGDAEPPVLRARASTLFTAGRFGEAEAAMRQLLSRNPNDDSALNDLGFLLADQGRSLDEAIDLLQRAVQIRPSEPAYLDSLGWALHRAGRSRDALPYLEDAVQKAGEREEPGIREHLGDVFEALGEPERARAEWQAALALGSDQPERLNRKLRSLATPTSSP